MALPVLRSLQLVLVALVALQAALTPALLVVRSLVNTRTRRALFPAEVQTPAVLVARLGWALAATLAMATSAMTLLIPVLRVG